MRSYGIAPPVPPSVVRPLLVACALLTLKLTLDVCPVVRDCVARLSGTLPALSLAHTLRMERQLLASLDWRIPTEALALHNGARMRYQEGARALFAVARSRGGAAPMDAPAMLDGVFADD